MTSKRAPSHDAALARAASYGAVYRQKDRPLHPTASAKELRRAFCRPLPEEPTDGEGVIEALIAAAEPGLVGNTDPSFYAWVMGASDPVGVAADWLTSIWGQNAGIYQTAPAAAIAEEAVSSWLLELLDLPRESSVGFVTGATMAAFVGLAAARSSVLHRVGYDVDRLGLQGAPLVRVYASDDAHATNYAALRYLGFGETNITRIPSDERGLMRSDDLAAAMDRADGPSIVIAQAGHINSGAYEDLPAIVRIAKSHGAWVHVDGAFGLWARVLPEKADITQSADLADSWSVDGHKWLQLPYDSGFAIVRDSLSHRRAMDITAGYLNQVEGDGRNPTEYNPELSRRARGFAAWAVFQAMGRNGVRDLVRGHCDAAVHLECLLADVPGLNLACSVVLNQLVLECGTADRADAMEHALNDRGIFARTADWKGRRVLRLSIISQRTDFQHIERLAGEIRQAWSNVHHG